MSSSGPKTRDTSTIALGLAKILVGPSLANIATVTQCLNTTTDSLGALNSSNFTSNVEYWTLMSGFPQTEDLVIPLSETAELACEFKEISPKNLAYARGIDASTGYDDNHSGEITLGTLSSPAYVRCEAVYTYPNQTNHMYIIFPRAQVKSSMEVSFNASDNAMVPITISAMSASSEVSGGDAAWDLSPSGRIYFD